MLSSHKKIQHPINEWPLDWNELLAYFELTDEGENEDDFWKAVVTEHISGKPINESESYKSYFQKFWQETVPKIRNEEDGLFSAIRMGADIYIANWLQQLSAENLNSQLSKKSKGGDTALHVATSEQNISMVRLLVKLKADVNAQGSSQETPLHVAAYYGDIDLFKMLLDAGADPKAGRFDSEKPIHVAVMAGSVDVVDELIKRDSSQLKIEGRERRTAFIRAAIDNKKAVMDVLLKHGDDINQLNPISGHGALHIAAQKNKTAMIDFLIEKGANVDLLSGNEMTSLGFCIAKTPPLLEAAEVLLKHGADLNAGDPTALQLFNQQHDNESDGYKELKELMQKHGATFDQDGHAVKLAR